MNQTSLQLDPDPQITEMHSHTAPCRFEDPPDFDVDAWFATPERIAESKNSLLEVTASWQGGLLDICHYDTPRRLTFGSDHRADFCYPLDDPHQNPQKTEFFPLIHPGKGGFLLCFDPEMEGTIEQNGEHFTLLELVTEGRAHYFHPSGLCYFPLVPGVEVQLHFNGLDIGLRFVHAARFHPSVFRRLDSNAHILSFSVLAHLLFAFLAILSSTPPALPPANIPSPKSTKTKAAPPPKKQTPPLIHLSPLYFCSPKPHNNVDKPHKRPPLRTNRACQKQHEQQQKRQRQRTP